jgi:Rrf2 family nitric oxide-sensitive transcriptional repressor
MRLLVYTDFALRLMMYLSVEPKRGPSVQEIASAYGISRHYLVKVVQHLREIGWIETIQGRGGGLRLRVSPEKIRLGDVVRATEEDFLLAECFDPEANTCVLAPACQLKAVLGRALKAFLAVLDEHTLADLRARPALLRDLLGLEPIGS